jgi:hypothetical protein
VQDEASFHALFATLNWAASIRDYFDKTGNSAWNDPTVAAIQFVRNRVHHHWADAIALIAVVSGPQAYGRTGGIRGGMIIRTGPPVLVTSWVWPPVSQLPQGRSTRGQVEYERDLEGHPVTEALDRLAILYRAHI